jgi:hypothetical protein
VFRDNEIFFSSSFLLLSLLPPTHFPQLVFFFVLFAFLYSYPFELDYLSLSSTSLNITLYFLLKIPFNSLDHFLPLHFNVFNLYHSFLSSFSFLYVDAIFIAESLRMGEDDEEAVEGVNAALGAMLSASPEDGTKVRCHSIIHSLIHPLLLPRFIVVVVYVM